MPDANRAMNSQHFGSDLTNIWTGLICRYGSDHFPLTFQPWRSLRSLNALVLSLYQYYGLSLEIVIPPLTGKRHNVLNLSVRLSVGLFVHCQSCERDILKMNAPILLQKNLLGKGMKRSPLEVRRSKVNVTRSRNRSNLWTQYFINRWTDLDANWHKWSMGQGDKMVDLWVRRSQVKVTRRQS